MDISFISKFDITGTTEVNIKKITYWGLDKEEKEDVGVEIIFNTNQNTLKCIEAFFNTDPNLNPIIDSGDYSVLLSLEVLKKITLG